jgi:23S rRNA (guanosine2251-2'-O)-methyltransferase
MPSQRRGEPELTASASDREDTGAFAAAAPSDLIWGRHSAQAVLEGGRPIHRIWCTPEMRFSARFLQLLREAKASGVLVEEVTWARLGQISGGAVHQGIVLQPAAAETLDLGTLIEGCAAIGEAPLLLAVDGLTDPQNLGAIVRSAEALGAHGMVLPQRRNAGLTGSVAKVAAGALEHLPIARVVNLNRSLDTLKQEGYRVIGLAGDGTVSLEEANLEGPLVVVTGSEGDGLSLLTRRTCDQLVRIPLRGATPSLNASVATALLLYEVARRSWMKGLGGSAPAPRLVRPALPSPPLPPSSQEGPELGGDPGPFESESIDDSAEIAPLAEAPRSEAPLELERIALDQPAADSNPGSADPLQDHAGSLQDHAEPLQEPGDGPGKSEPVEPFTQSAAGAEEATAIPGAGYPAERSGGGAADAPTVATAGAPTSFPTGAPDPATAAQPWQASLSPTTQPASAPAPEPQFDADILL